MADWSSLPADLVRLIASKLSAIDEFACLTAVCRSYRSAVPKTMWHLDGCSRPPWLLLCCQGGSDDDNPPPTTSERGILNLYKNNKRFVMDLPEIHGRHCWGSTYGWIVTLGLDQQLHLFNPLNRRRILLPQTICEEDWGLSVGDEHRKLRRMRKLHIDRALIFKRPTGSYSSSGFNDFLVVTIRHSQFHVLRPDCWARVKSHFLDQTVSYVYVYDCALYRDQFYMLAAYGRLFVCSNFDGPGTPTAHECNNYGYGDLLEGTEKLYLLESLDQLLMVVRFLKYAPDSDSDEDDAVVVVTSEPHYKTIGFEAYQFDHVTKRWIEVEDLGDRAIFVGDCQSISLPQPEKLGCKRNCVYFTDDNYEQFGCEDFGDVALGGYDMGIYDFDKMTIEPLYEGTDSLSKYSAPTWLQPSVV